MSYTYHHSVNGKPRCGKCHHMCCPSVILPISKRGNRSCGDCDMCLHSVPEEAVA